MTDAVYNAHFRFRESPFGVTPDPQFYYSNAANLAVCAALRRGIEERRGVILIVGEPGTGKTTLLKKVLSDLGPSIDTAYLSQTSTSETSLLGIIASDLGWMPASPHTAVTLPQIQQLLSEKSRVGKNVALMIDEAQELSSSCLEELAPLAGLKLAEQPVLQIVLAGHPELEEKLNAPELRALKQRVALRCVVERLGTEDVGPYIDARLRAIGRSGDELFEPQAIERIAAHSRGIPRVINLLCDHALLLAYVVSASMITGAMADEVAADLALTKTQDDNDGSAPLTAPADGKPPKTDLPRQKLFAVAVNHSASRRLLSIKHLGYALGGLLLISVFASSIFLDWRKDALFGLNLATDPKTAPGNDSRSAESAGAIPGHADPSAPPLPPINMAQAADPKSIDPPPAQQPDNALMRAEKSPAQNSDDPAKNVETAQRAGYVVVGRSFVRASPSSSAEIVATLEPGADINVAGRTGEYFRIRAAGPEAITGYVHREDAFFERKR